MGLDRDPQQPFPNTTPQAGNYIDNGAGLSQVWSLAPGETHAFDSRFTVSPLLVTSQDCAQQNVSTVLGVDDLNPPANTPHRVDVIYDPRFLWPTTDADWQTRAQGIAKTIRDRADLTLEAYANLGFSVPSPVHIKIECNPATLGIVPGPGDGLTDYQFVRLRSSAIRSEFASGQGDPLSYWAYLVDHELYHAVQINQAALFGAIDVTVRQYSGDWVLIESGATLAEDLIADHDDDPNDAMRQSYLNLVNAWMDDPTPIQTDDPVAKYRVAGFLQYLGERFGDQSEQNLERRVAGFLKSAQNQLHWRSSGLEATITGSIPWFGPDKVYDALRDFYLAGYINAAANPSPDTQIKDQFTRHSGASTGSPVYYRAIDREPTRSLASGPLTISTPADSPTLSAETGRIYEIGLPNLPNQVSLTIKQTGLLPASLRIGILTTGADGTIRIPPNGRATTDAPFDPDKTFTIPTVGVDKIAIAVIATGKDADYQITATPLAGTAAITMVKPTAAQPTTVSSSTARLAIPVWVRPSLDGGATMQGGLHGSAFTATIDGNNVPVSFAVENDTDYRLSLAPGTLAVGAHTVIVRFGGVATAGGTVNVINDGGNRQIAAAGPLGTLGQGQSATTTATVAATSGSAEFNLAWTGSDFDLTLTSPTGRVITETTQAADVQVVQAATSVKIVVTAPTAGVWQIEGAGITVPAPEPVTYQVDERDAAIGADVSVGGLNKAGTPLRIRAAVTDVGTGIANAKVVATIKDGAGVTRRFPLLDDGGHGDGFANDGAYGAVAWATDAAGVYSVSITAIGTDSAGRAYSRVASTTATLAAKVDTDGDGLADAVEPWFGLNPSVADAAVDRDGDGLMLPAELSAGLDPYSADTDGGLETDSSELARGTDPRDMTDDAALPGAVLTADAIDGNKISVGLATKGQTGQVHLDRIQGTTRVDLGLFPGTHRTIIDGPLAAGGYTYEAYVVGASGARSMPITAGPVTPRVDATIPFVNVRVNNGNRWTNSGTVVVELTDLTERVTDMRFATSEAALATAAWLPFRAVTTASIPATSGLHTIYAQVRDASGLASDTATGTVMIDVIAPQSAISTLPAFTNAPSVDVAYTASDADAGVLAGEVWQRYRSSSTAAWSAWSLTATGSASPIPVALGLGDGDYEMYSIAIDRAQNREAAPAAGDVAITLDRVLPVTQAGPLPPTSSGSTPIPFTASDDRSGISTVELWWRYRATSTGTWGAWTLGPSGTTSPIAFTYPSGDGFYEFYSIGVDAAGNREAAPGSADASTEKTSSSPWGQINQVNDDATTTSQVYPDVAIGPSGAAIAVWQDYRASPPESLFSQYDIYASRWDPTTETWSANARVNDVATSGQYAPAVAVDGSNNAYAVWVDGRNGRTDIYFSKRSAATGAWSANVRVNSATSFNSQADPAIAVSPNGDAIALWYRKTNNKLNLWSARLPAGGTTWGPEIRVTSNQTNVKQAPSVTFGSDGTAYAVWMDPAANNTDIWFASLPPGSSTWSTNTKISDDLGTAYQGQPDIGVDGAGNVLVVWTDRRANPYELRVRRRPAGGAWLPSTVIAADDGLVPSLAVRPDGRAYVAWQDGYCNLEYPGVWGATYDPASTSWSAPERIDTNGPDLCAGNPSTALDADKTMVLWSNSLNLPSGENDDDVVSRLKSP